MKTPAPSIRSRRFILRPLKHGWRTAGFTLLEIMLVVMIIALLAGSAIFLMRNNVDIARRTRAEADLENIKTQLQMYESFNGMLPSTEQGLQALVDKPSGDPAPRKWQRLMPDVPLDPWGIPYQLRNPATRTTKEGYELFSCGKDRLPGTADDIGNT